MTDLEVSTDTGSVVVLRRARRLMVAAMVLALAGMILQIATGVPYPKVPPGPIMVGVGAALILFVRWRWMPALGVLISVFLTIGAVASGASVRMLAAPGSFGPFLGTLAQLVGELVAIVAGVAALVIAARGSRARP
ncbi:MAG: hypothetical protein J2O49_06895 [Sciscionella sp.]|nr:hypothetical protein [Sciscionella sp.]